MFNSTQESHSVVIELVIKFQFIVKIHWNKYQKHLQELNRQTLLIYSPVSGKPQKKTKS